MVDFEYIEIFGEWEDVKDEKFKFYVVGFRRFDKFVSGKVDGGDFFLSNVECYMFFYFFNWFEEGGGIKVVCNVGSMES